MANYDPYDPSSWNKKRSSTTNGAYNTSSSNTLQQHGSNPGSSDLTSQIPMPQGQGYSFPTPHNPQRGSNPPGGATPSNLLPPPYHVVPPPQDSYPSQPPPSNVAPDFGTPTNQYCRIPGCRNKAYYDFAEQEQKEYCGQGHELQAISTGLVNTCAMCKGRPRRTGERVCGRTCRERERQATTVQGSYYGVPVVRQEPRSRPGP